MNEDKFLVNEEEPLNNKVALLILPINNNSFGDRFLALALASYGADVALVIKAENVEQAKETKKHIEAMGRRCLIIQREEYSEATFSRKVVHKTIAEFGGLDIFIDHSFLPEQRLSNENQGDPLQLVDKNYKARFSTTIDMMAAVLNHIVPNEKK